MLVHDEWLLTTERVAVHVPTSTAVLADPHLGYHSARRRRGEAVPVPALDDLLAPLAAVLQKWSLSRLVVAGDLFEDGVDDAILAGLAEWHNRHGVTNFAVVPGNHDRRLVDNSSGVRVFAEGVKLASWIVLHGDKPLPRRPVVCGHWHPALRAGNVNHACYLVGKQSIVLPAYCREAHGVSVRARQEWRGQRCIVSAGDEMLDFGQLGKAGPLQRIHPGEKTPA